MIGMWGQVREIYDARNKEESRRHEEASNSSSMPSMSGMSSILNQAKSMSSGSFRPPHM